MTLRNTITLAFGILGILWYYVCLIAIGMNLIDPAQGETTFRDFMSVSITTIGVSLATFVGMILGLRGVSEGIRETATATPAGKAADKMHALALISAGTTLQWVAAGLYVLSLFLALYFWSALS
jgi:hypothetical protein